MPLDQYKLKKKSLVVDIGVIRDRHGLKVVYANLWDAERRTIGPKIVFPGILKNIVGKTFYNKSDVRAVARGLLEVVSPSLESIPIYVHLVPSREALTRAGLVSPY